MTLLIKGATLLTPGQADLHGKKRDILIEGGKLIRIGSRLNPSGKVKTISLPNLHVSPGWFDSSVSFGEPGYEERETIENGLRVAALSGFTGIVLNSNSKPVPDTSGDIVFLKDQGRNALTELFPLGSLSMGSKGEDLAELLDMQGAGAIGFSDYKAPIENPNLLKLALLYTQSFKGLVYSHPLDNQVAKGGQVHEGTVAVRLGLKGVAPLAEHLRIARDLDILEYTGGSLHIPTISSAESVSRIAEAKKKGLDVTCSVAISHLLFTEKNLEDFDTNFKTQPPLRSEADRKTLIKGLKTGIIDFACSDHSPLDIEEKRLEFDRAAFGSLGLESAFGALNKLLGAEESTAILCRGRKRYGLQEVQLNEGETANLTLFNPEPEFVLESESLESTSKNSMFQGATLKGKVYGVIRGAKSNL
ncbi:dihydroorotase [Robiginitalea myxolifaciens]|uniref:Dihydroorotase n=1 Tax=Robiginitalea myxolifaciens TaxID=400055 RepID=A0A1I6GV91_9FLAO|nr:dihydroorotase [Robiginitalea myxolifaciens]SFR46155.1 dihydroorotase [Robiginitalea myxolifaciens]